ncbi:MAG: prepilin peptidase [Thermogutta sp.]|nr:prepilin peptidase [Thermogutta sp.]
MLATVVLLILLAAAAATDVTRGKIFNWITYPGIVSAIALNGAGSLGLAGGWWSRDSAAAAGWIGVTSSLMGLAACGLVMIACYVFFRVGGGDVKLIAMMGAFLGPEQGILAMLWTFVLGACAGLILLVWRLGPIRLLASVTRHLLWSIRLGGFNPLTPEQRKQLEPPLFLAPAAFFAVIVVRFELAERWLPLFSP